MSEKTKLERCRFCHSHAKIHGHEFKMSHYCVVDGWEDDKVKTVSEKQCNSCERFQSKFIEYPITVKDIVNKNIDTTGISCKCGDMCEVTLCNDDAENRSYIGICLGELPISILSSYNKNTGVLTNDTLSNPAIFVPELKRIVYGCESFWRRIDSIEDFKGITKEDIENTWYVSLLRKMAE